MSKRVKKLQKISRRLTTHQLRRLQEKDVSLGFDSLFTTSETERGSPYFLGYYSPSGIKYALEKYGLFEFLEKKGFRDLRLTINTSDPYKQRIAIHSEKKHPDHLLGELVVKRKHITIYPPFPTLIHGRDFEVIAVEWLCMQNPRAEFPPEKPRLPGQKYPGLGIGEMVMEILVIMCGRLRTAGLVNTPEHFHNAQMYSTQFRYLEPLCEGKRRAIERDLLSKYSLSEVSWGIDLECVKENGKTFTWPNYDQIIPLDRDLKDYFESKEYHNHLQKHMEEYHYDMDYKKCVEKKMKQKDFLTC